MSHCGSPSFDNHLNHCLVVLKHIQRSFLMRKLNVWWNTINIIQHVDHSLRSLVWSMIFVTVHNGSPRSIKSLNCFQRQKQSDTTNRERESRLISIQNPKRWFRTLLNCEKQQFVSCTSNLLEQMYDFQKRSLHCFAILNIKQYCLYSHVWWM